MSKKSREWKMEAKYRDVSGYKRMYSLKRYKEKKRLEAKMLRRMNKGTRNIFAKTAWGYSGRQAYKLFCYWTKQTAFAIQLVKELEEMHYTPGPGARIIINGQQILSQM